MDKTTLALGFLTVLVGLMVVFLLVWGRRMLNNDRKEETFTLDDLPQNMDKRKAVIGKTLLDIKSDTAKILGDLKETKELIVSSTQDIIKEIRAISERQEAVYTRVEQNSLEEKADEKSLGRIQQNGVSSSVSNGTSSCEVVFNSLDYLDFYTKYIEPLIDKMDVEDRSNVKILLDIMKIIDSKGGDVPSVVNDLEGQNFRNEKIGGSFTSSYDILKKVNLRQHTLNVAEATVEILKEKYGEINQGAIKDFIVAFAHDLGKLPEERPKDYSTESHPVISGKILQKILEKSTYDQKVKEALVQAVEDHHKAPRNLYGEILKQADQKAREKEKRELVGEQGVGSVIQIAEKDGVLIPEKEVVKIILEAVVNYVNKKVSFNRGEGNKKTYWAYFFKNKVYVDPEIPYHHLRNKKDIQLPVYFYDNDQENVSRAKTVIANTFRKLGYLDERIKEGYYSANFEFFKANGEKKASRMLVLKAEAFNEIEFPVSKFPDLAGQDVLQFVKLASRQSS